MKSTSKILIVDDKTENLFALRIVPKDLDIQIEEATSGNDALKKTLHHDFALALIDIQMPGMDGYELAKILREEEKTGQLPFIFISAVYTDNTDVFKGYEKGAFSFITKPFQPEILINKVKFFIDKHQQEVSLFELNKDLINKNKELAFQNEEKEKRSAELTIANKELLAFTYVSSHDLQEPLRKIQTFAHVILENENKNLSDKGKYNFHRIQAAAARMQHLIEDLLSFSRISTSEHTFEKTDLNVIIENVKSELKETIQEKHAIIESTEICPANIIAFQFHQLMVNLISNALKFSHPNIPPHIIIKSRIVKGCDIDIPKPVKKDGSINPVFEKIFPEKLYCQIIVKDNGIGFEPRFSERIFEVFQKLHSKEEYSGTGIGLAIVKKIVDNHNGFIIATSELMQGSTFDIFIPAD